MDDDNFALALEYRRLQCRTELNLSQAHTSMLRRKLAGIEAMQGGAPVGKRRAAGTGCAARTIRILRESDRALSVAEIVEALAPEFADQQRQVVEAAVRNALSAHREQLSQSGSSPRRYSFKGDAA